MIIVVVNRTGKPPLRGGHPLLARRGRGVQRALAAVSQGNQAGASIPLGSSWFLLVPLGSSWFLLVPLGSSWFHTTLSLVSSVLSFTNQ